MRTVLNAIHRLLRKARKLAGWALVRILGWTLLAALLTAAIAVALLGFITVRSWWGWFSSPVTPMKVILSVGLVCAAGIVWFVIILMSQTRDG